MTTTYTATFYCPPNPVKRFLIVVPEPEEKDFYRQAVSISSFKTREGKRACFKNNNLRPPPKDLTWCLVSYEPDKPWMGLAVEYEEVEGVWEFYKRIGYDYKSKRYLREA